MSETAPATVEEQVAVVGEPASEPHQAAVVGEPVPLANGLQKDEETTSSSPSPDQCTDNGSHLGATPDAGGAAAEAEDTDGGGNSGESSRQVAPEATPVSSGSSIEASDAAANNIEGSTSSVASDTESKADAPVVEERSAESLPPQGGTPAGGSSSAVNESVQEDDSNASVETDVSITKESSPSDQSGETSAIADPGEAAPADQDKDSPSGSDTAKSAADSEQDPVLPSASAEGTNEDKKAKSSEKDLADDDKASVSSSEVTKGAETEPEQTVSSAYDSSKLNTSTSDPDAGTVNPVQPSEPIISDSSQVQEDAISTERSINASNDEDQSTSKGFAPPEDPISTERSIDTPSDKDQSTSKVPDEPNALDASTPDNDQGTVTPVQPSEPLVCDSSKVEEDEIPTGRSTDTSKDEDQITSRGLTTSEDNATGESPANDLDDLSASKPPIANTSDHGGVGETESRGTDLCAEQANGGLSLSNAKDVEQKPSDVSCRAEDDDKDAVKEPRMQEEASGLDACDMSAKVRDAVDAISDVLNKEPCDETDGKKPFQQPRISFIVTTVAVAVVGVAIAAFARPR